MTHGRPLLGRLALGPTCPALAAHSADQQGQVSCCQVGLPAGAVHAPELPGGGQASLCSRWRPSQPRPGPILRARPLTQCTGTLPQTLLLGNFAFCLLRFSSPLFFTLGDQGSVLPWNRVWGFHGRSGSSLRAAAESGLARARGLGI